MSIFRKLEQWSYTNPERSFHPKRERESRIELRFMTVIKTLRSSPIEMLYSSIQLFKISTKTIKILLIQIVLEFENFLSLPLSLFLAGKVKYSRSYRKVTLNKSFKFAESNYLKRAKRVKLLKL